MPAETLAAPAAPPRFGPAWAPEELLLLRAAVAQGSRGLERLPATLAARGFPRRSPEAIQRKLWRLSQPRLPGAPGPPLSEAEHRLILEQARLGARPAQIRAALTAAGFTRSRWTVARHLVRLRKSGLLAPPELSASPAKTHGSPHPWAEPPDKADREALVAGRLRWLARGLPPTGLALTLPGYQWQRTLAALNGLADEIVAIERDPAIYQALLTALRQSPPTTTPFSLLHADFWAVAAAPPGAVRILDYDGMDAMRPDLLDALRRALESLTPRAVLRLTFETAKGASLDAVLDAIAAHRPIEAVWSLPHQRGYPMVTALARVGPTRPPAPTAPTKEPAPWHGD